jgi:hypothetical protein
MTEAEQEHIAAIEHDLATAVDRRSCVTLDDIDADVLLRELARLRNQAMDFADVFNQLYTYMEETRVTYWIAGLVAHPDIVGYMKTATTMPLLPVEHYKQGGDSDCGFYGESYFPTTYPDGDGGVLYLHVTWTE